MENVFKTFKAELEKHSVEADSVSETCQYVEMNLADEEVVKALASTNAAHQMEDRNLDTYGRWVLQKELYKLAKAAGYPVPSWVE